MDPQRYQKIKQVLMAVVEAPASDRSALLASECGPDDELRREVEELLALEVQQSFMEHAPVELEAELVNGDASGQRLGRIRLERLIARGGMGAVYAGVDELLQRPVAVKLMQADLRMSAVRRSAFLAEAQVLSSLRHPNICQVHDFFEDREQDVLVLELIEGETLRSVLEEGPASDPIAIAVGVADALVAAHERGIVHRDLKPENVMLTSEGQVKVLDFGLARSEAGHAVTTSVDADPGRIGKTQIAGTPGYLAPEQARGEISTTATDLWSFGLLLMELLTGRRPFPPGSSSAELIDRAQRAEVEVPAGLPSAESNLLRKLLAPEPAERLSAREARVALARIADRGRRRLRIGLAASLAAVAALAGLKYTLDLRTERELAVEAQTRAETARGEAEDLASFMLTELYSDLREVGRLQLLEPVALKANEYFRGLDAEGELGERGGRGERGIALIRVAEVLDLQGHLEEATDAYRRAVEVLRPLAAERPEDELVHYRLALAERNLGEVLRFGGDYGAGDPHVLTSIEMARDLTEGLAPGTGPAESPDAAERWSLLLRALYLHADSLVRQGEARRALELLSEAERLAVPALALQPTLRRDLGDIRFKRCMATYDLRNVESVVDACTASFEMDKALHDQNPDDFKLLDNLMTAYWMLGRAQAMGGSLKRALATTREGESISRQLLARDPARADARNSVAVMLVSKGIILRRMASSRAAEQAFRSVLEITGPLLADGRDHAALHNHVIALAMLGRLEEARPHALELWESGWRRPEFVDLVEEYDLVVGVNRAG